MPPAMQNTAVSQSPVSRGHAGRAPAPIRDRSTKPGLVLMQEERGHKETSLLKTLYPGRVFGCEKGPRPRARKRVLLYDLSSKARNAILEMDATGHYSQDNLPAKPDITELIDDGNKTMATGPLRTMDYFEALKAMEKLDPEISFKAAGQISRGNFYPM